MTLNQAQQFGKALEIQAKAKDQFDENFKLHYRLKKDSQNYDTNAVDHRSQKVDIDSQQVNPNYCIGVMKDNQFLLTPLTSFHQLRPSFDHVDKERQLRLINSAQIQAEKRAAQAKIQRVGTEQSGMQQMINESNKEWKDLKYFSMNSYESEMELEKLCLFKSSRKNINGDHDMIIEKQGDDQWSLISSHEFQDLLAPFDKTEDFSTASILKNKGSNLTIEVLAQLSPIKMLELIMKKAGIIDLERLVRIMLAACKLANIDMLPQDQLIDLLSDHMYDFTVDKRKVALREYLINQIYRNGQITLDQIKKETKTQFGELKLHIQEVTNSLNEILTFKNYGNSKLHEYLKPKHNKQIKESWDKLEHECKKYQELKFYRDQADQKLPEQLISTKQEQQMKKQMFQLIECLVKHFTENKVSNYPKLITSIKDSKITVQDQDQFNNILVEYTVSMGDRIFLRKLENEQEQQVRDIIIQLFSLKQQYKKPDFKKQVNERLQQTDLTDKELQKLIGYYTTTQGNMITMIQP
ncbi:dna-directed rna polymerase iii subunit rpc5-like [Stylonychia lemnae]|nr:dna-directed rna polymerase iii subunit rpc5-like [Stylonychia lemnae]|eukprot:CDW74584.1 dna-directed rna polymerase iii subunit rpc5-like [Stylonychia lemnae]